MRESFDIAVIGAGVFGSWIAYLLQKAGAKVALIDAYGPGNSRASSGGESRVSRLGYGPDLIYTRSAQRSLLLWKELFKQQNDAQALFRETGVLWLAREADSYCEATLKNLQVVGTEHQRLSKDELQDRYPQLKLDSIDWGILETSAGILMARRAVQAVCAAAKTVGVKYFQGLATAPSSDGQMKSVEIATGEKLQAQNFIFACGPWLPKLFPALLADRFQISKQEVFFFGIPAGDQSFNPENLPAWIDFHDLVYGIPNLDNRGFKFAIDAHGPDFDPDNGERVASEAGLAATRKFLAKRLPALANAPVLESRVCQYENTSNGDFLIDAHPDFQNAWLVGGGSGHGFKHGPAVGEYVVRIISGEGPIEQRFSLASKEKVHERKVY